MALQNRHSHTEGAVPNLVPGQAAINLKDEVLWLRAAGTKVSIDLAAWKVRAVPAVGADGAPLVRTSAGVAFDAALAPSSTVDGAVVVDPAGTGVPGVYAAAVGAPIALGADDVLVEPFWVASDQISVTNIAFKAVTTPTGAVRVGICADDGTVLGEHLFATPALGANAATLALDLPRGLYHLVLWSAAAVSLFQMTGFRSEQGWSDAGAGVPSFIRRPTVDPMDLSAGLALPDVTGAVVSASPGEDRSVMIQWT